MGFVSRSILSIRSTLHRWWQSLLSWLNEAPPDQPTIFRSARLKLTGFYLAILLALCLTLTLSVRALAEQEYANAGLGERGIVRRLLFDQFSVPPQPTTTFNDYQTKQESVVTRHLDEDVILINLAVLILGGWLSYWFAGRTLKPIEEAHESQTRFTADASHELRTPLANLKVENEVFLRQKSFTQTEARHLIESNLEEVQRLESLANNLLALTRYGQTALRLQAVNISEIVGTAVSQLDKLADSKHMSVQTDVRAATVLANADSLVQLLTIVLDNALKYGPDKSTVHIHGASTANAYTLSVRDEGPGIAPNDLPYIFDRLFRADKARSSKVSGYGLGLSLAREIIRANRGSIEASNSPSGGALFRITLNQAGQQR